MKEKNTTVVVGMGPYEYGGLDYRKAPALLEPFLSDCGMSVSTIERELGFRLFVRRFDFSHNGTFGPRDVCRAKSEFSLTARGILLRHEVRGVHDAVLSYLIVFVLVDEHGRSRPIPESLEKALG